MGPAPPQVQCRAVRRWLSVHSNGRGRGKRGSGEYLILFFFFCLGTIHQGRALLQPSHHSHSKQTQTLLPFSMLQYNFSRQSRHPRCSSCKNYLYVMFHAQRGKLHYCTLQKRGVRRDGGKGGLQMSPVRLLALACPPGLTLVARRDDPLLLRGNDDHSASGLLFC